MNVQEIITEINKDLDDELNNDQIIGWINRAIDDLNPISKKQMKKAATISSENSYALPDDAFEVVMVAVNNNKYFPVVLSDTFSQGYKIWNNVLSIQPALVDGEIELYYYKRLSHVAGLTDTPEIDSAFHDLFVLYTVAHNQFMDHMDDWQAREADALNRYYKRKSEFEAYINQTSFDVISNNSVQTIFTM